MPEIDLPAHATAMLLADKKDRVEAIAKALITYETLDGADIDRIMKGEVLTKPTVGDLLAKENERAVTIAPNEDPKLPDISPAGPGLGGTLPAPG